ncbi:MAG: CDP-diacylglycerol--glycerol-3-phosphate 3-phosphatidyltransferase [Nitrospirota bacterium]
MPEQMETKEKIHNKQSFFNIPNLLTLIRILLIPIFIILFNNPTSIRSILSAIIFLIASLTDLLDGYIARQRDQITRIGRLMDPVADKLLISSALIILVGFGRVQSWIAILIIGRELFITGLRAIASSEGIIISAESTGKYKLILQITAIIFLILDYRWSFFDFLVFGKLLLLISIVLSVISGYQYLTNFWKGVKIGEGS